MGERETEKDDTVEITMRRLCHAAIEGNVALLANLHHEDPLLLDRYQLYEGQLGSPPLHVASKLGHFEFVVAILEIKVSPSMCLSHNSLGRNPLHVATIKGQLDVLEVLVRAMPQVARDRVGGPYGETALHLCVKFDQLEALKFLVKSSICDNKFLNAKDSDDNTIMHIAMANKQHEVRLIKDHDPVSVGSAWDAESGAVSPGEDRVDSFSSKNAQWLLKAGALEIRVFSGCRKAPGTLAFCRSHCCLFIGWLLEPLLANFVLGLCLVSL
ncbi:hypothetical protein Ancab_001933 [Ancistrocladus abbreviatus]